MNPQPQQQQQQPGAGGGNQNVSEHTGTAVGVLAVHMLMPTAKLGCERPSNLTAIFVSCSCDLAMTTLTAPSPEACFWCPPTTWYESCTNAFEPHAVSSRSMPIVAMVLANCQSYPRLESGNLLQSASRATCAHRAKRAVDARPTPPAVFMKSLTAALCVP